jgi:hypothetical protein
MDNTDNVNDKTNSILNDIKKLLGIAPDYTNFDTDIIININSVFMILNQLGVGPKEGFKITGANETWDNYIDEDDDLEAVKTYIWLKVKIVFDPPLNSTVMEAHKQMISEYEWRLNIQSEGGKSDVDL